MAYVKIRCVIWHAGYSCRKSCPEKHITCSVPRPRQADLSQSSPKAGHSKESPDGDSGNCQEVQEGRTGVFPDCKPCHDEGKQQPYNHLDRWGRARTQFPIKSSDARFMTSAIASPNHSIAKITMACVLSSCRTITFQNDESHIWSPSQTHKIASPNRNAPGSLEVSPLD